MLTLCLHKKKGLPEKPLQAFVFYGAGDKIRTRDRLITNQLLYHLSYASLIVDAKGRCVDPLG